MSAADELIEHFRAELHKARTKDTEGLRAEIERWRLMQTCPHCEGSGMGRDENEGSPCNTCDGGSISGSRGAEWAEKCARLALEARSPRDQQSRAQTASTDLVRAVMLWARERGPWDSGNPDHTAEGGVDGELYNAAVRACHAGVVPKTCCWRFGDWGRDHEPGCWRAP